ncbi:MAG: hypothetical protein DRH12_01295 [Deltaproteobacteria bacterium]|nr:MAG: hypothetical protein DRH12_01295 [Deltaproteobacteria bacterium]
MKSKVIDITKHKLARRRGLSPDRIDLQQMSRMTGTQILKSILELEDPEKAVQALSPQDYYWLIKKIGEDDCLPILELGNTRQWHHVMDLEIWERDRIDLSQASLWMKRLQIADGHELAKWLYTEGQHFAYYYFFKTLEIRIVGHDDPVDLPEGFFTLDGVFYVRSKDPELRESVQRILEAMASLDLERYHTLLVGLSGVLPAELEEEMFRLRNIRIAEYGFLPFDEAMSVYSALPPRAVVRDNSQQEENVVSIEDEDVKSIIPLAPLYHAQQSSLLVRVASQSRDEEFLERLRLEFAGLCNQILSAEGLRIDRFEVLVKTCRRAAGYLNVALEKLCNIDLTAAEQILRKNPLLNVFRVGFGLALRLKWDVERWIKQSWFARAGLSVNFWGDKWGSVLSGILQKKPLYYVGDREGELYRDFEALEEVEEVRTVFMRCRALDALLAQLSPTIKSKEEVEQEVTFHGILFTFWGHHLLGHALTHSPFGIDDAKKLLGKLRAGEKRPPYKMEEHKEVFVRYYRNLGSSLERNDQLLLAETLSLLWEEFQEEYQWVDIGYLDPRFSKFLRIRPSP